MNVRDYLEIIQYDSGNTTQYNKQVMDYFKVDYSDMSLSEVDKKVSQLTNIVMNENIKDKIKIKGKWYMIEKDLMDAKFTQWLEVDGLLGNADYLNEHLSEAISIYVRPRKWRWFRWVIEKWDIKKRDELTEKLKEMDIGEALGLNVFFYQNAQSSIRIMKMFYLQKTMRELKQMMKQNN